MLLRQLHLLNFRSFKDALFNFKETVLIYGENGTGKTSLIEAIHFSLKAKSFRTLSINAMVKNDSNFFRISTNIKDQKRIIEKKVGKSIHKLNYENFAKYDYLPLFLNNLSLRFLEQNKDERRAFIDYFLFHVKQEHLDNLKRFKKILLSRNKALKEENKNQISVWTKLFIESSEQINKDRERIVKKILENLESNILNKLKDERWKNILSSLQISFHSGWEGESLENVLRANYEEDLLKGYTKFGAHKFDLEIKVLGESSGNILSRGEQKLLILLTFISFGNYLENLQDKHIIYLIDDLPSEFDEKNLNLALEFLSLSSSQKIITSVNKIENKTIQHLIDL